MSNQELDEVKNNYMKDNSREFSGKFKIRLIDYKGRKLFIRGMKRDPAVSAKNSKIVAWYFHVVLNCKQPKDELG